MGQGAFCSLGCSYKYCAVNQLFWAECSNLEVKKKSDIIFGLVLYKKYAAETSKLLITRPRKDKICVQNEKITYYFCRRKKCFPVKLRHPHSSHGHVLTVVWFSSVLGGDNRKRNRLRIFWLFVSRYEA